MTEKKWIELIHRELDGELSGREQAELQAILDKNPALRELRDQLHRTGALLDQIGEVEPSPHVKVAIMNQLPARRRPAAATAVAAGARRQPWRSAFGWGFSFAAGLAAGLLLAYAGFFSAAQMETGSLSGSLIEPAGAPEFRAGPAVTIELGNLEGQLEVQTTEKLALVELRLTGEATRIALTYSPDTVTVLAASPLTERTLQAGRLEFTHADTTAVYRFLFSRTQQGSTNFMLALHNRAGEYATTVRID